MSRAINKLDDLTPRATTQEASALIDLEKRRETNRKWAEANPDKVRESARKFRDANPDKHRELNKRWAEANPEKIRAANQRYRENNREKRRETYRKWAAANPDKRLALDRKRRARKAGAEGEFTTDEFAALCELFENRCAYCDTDAKLTADHVVPLSKGGSDHIENILPACQPCNSSKGTKSITTWLQEAV